MAILELANRHLGTVYVLSTVLSEVSGLDEPACDQLGISVIEPETEDLIEAASRRGRLSVADRLCLLVARSRSFTCVTNDTALRKECTSEEIPLLWGLEVMALLVEEAALNAEDAIEVSLKIKEANPFHITASLIERFSERVREAEGRPR